jgi:aminocarboxymuconate-semialdehyde decarboxylase
VPFYLTNLLGNPSETALAAAQMIFGDLPSLFPT